jgi:putative FmdB family regulatory protein
MPTYCYFCDKCGGTFERQLPMARADERQACDTCGRFASRDFVREQTKAARCENWPMESDAAGVHPSQVREATEYAQQVGVPTDYTPDGRAIFRSRKHRAKYLKAHGMVDRDAGYSD